MDIRLFQFFLKVEFCKFRGHGKLAGIFFLAGPISKISVQICTRGTSSGAFLIFSKKHFYDRDAHLKISVFKF